MILVTGATGTVGSEVVKQLKSTNQPFKIAVSSPEKVANAKAQGLDAVVLDYTRPETFAPALQGVDKLFLLSPPGLSELEAGLIDAAKKAGIKQIVKQSAMGAAGEDNIFGREHRANEKLIEASGIPYTFLRPNGFMQNYINEHGDTIKQQGAFYLSQADSRYSAIDVRDIAAVAVKALTEPGHTNKAYTLTGPESLSNFDIADKLSSATGRKIDYVPVTDDELRKGMKGMGAPDSLVEGVVDLMHYYKDDKASAVTQDVENVTGRKPISFNKFARDNAEAFTGTAAAD